MLHQYQRERKRIAHHGQTLEYIEATIEDIALANRLAHSVLGRTLDELPPQTRKLLAQVHEAVTARSAAQAIATDDYRFSRRELRDWLGWSDTALKVHLARLVEMEYLLVHRGGRGQSFRYELLYHGEGDAGAPFVNGLIDVDALRYDATRSGRSASRSGAGQPAVSRQSGGGPSANMDDVRGKSSTCEPTQQNHVERSVLNGSHEPSYRSDTHPLAASDGV